MTNCQASLAPILCVALTAAGCSGGATRDADLETLNKSTRLMCEWSATAQGLLDELKEIEGRKSGLKDEHKARFDWLLKQGMKGAEVVAEINRSGAGWVEAYKRLQGAGAGFLGGNMEVIRPREEWAKEQFRSGGMWDRVAAHAAPMKRRVDYVTIHPDLEEEISLLLLRGQVKIGMSEEYAKISWGEPGDNNKTITAAGVHEQWVYGDISHRSYLYFDNGKLTSIQN